VCHSNWNILRLLQLDCSARRQHDMQPFCLAIDSRTASPMPGYVRSCDGFTVFYVELCWVVPGSNAMKV
jgi:hypothetical protein